METKIFVLTEETSSYRLLSTTYKTILGAYLNRREAEFELWKARRGEKRLHDMYTNYSLQEVTVLKSELSSREYALFVKEKEKELKDAAVKAREHSEKDLEQAAEAERQIELLTK